MLDLVDIQHLDDVAIGYGRHLVIQAAAAAKAEMPRAKTEPSIPRQTLYSLAKYKKANWAAFARKLWCSRKGAILPLSEASNDEDR